MDVEELQTRAEEPPPQLLHMIVTFCIFLDIEASYDESGKELFTASNFIDRLREIDHQSIKPVVVEKAKRYLQLHPLDPATMKTISPLAGLLGHFLMSIYRYTSEKVHVNRLTVAKIGRAHV
jgi:hypothetical protein